MGYGDISGNNTTERVVSAIFMVIGVIGFSFASGSLTSIMANVDAASAILKDKEDILK